MNQIVVTEDGSHTIYNEELEEHYHSINGAIQESNHVFINAGLKSLSKKELSILEIGFGTGLNAFLTLLESIKTNQKINYTSVERYPLNKNVYHRLNYHNILGEKELFLKLHEVAWNEHQKINKCFCLKKLKDDLQNITFDSFFDLVYFDAFSPKVQPELWTIGIFRKISNHMKPGAILTSYSAKGEVKRTLEACGFKVERIPGPPGKREMIRGIKS